MNAMPIDFNDMARELGAGAIRTRIQSSRNLSRTEPEPLPPRCDRVLIEADTRSATTNEGAYYVAISRAREDVRIYTDDKAMLP